MEKPDYVVNFVRPPNTEIKYIGGHWYLYERSSVYDPKIKRSRKVSGKILGSITEQGFIPSKARSRSTESATLDDIVEVGAVNYLYDCTEWMRIRLQKHFPDSWVYIYVTVLICAAYHCCFHQLQLHYENSILSYLYPDLSFQPAAFTQFLDGLGRMRGEIRSYMQETVAEHECFLLFDGHSILSSSDDPEYGYDAKLRYNPQINLLYMFSRDGSVGVPVYYKQYPGSTNDIEAFSDILKESTAYADSCIVIGGDDFDLLEECELNYVAPLKRGNRLVQGHIPGLPFQYENIFAFNERGIASLTIQHEGFNVHLFLDVDLLARETADLAERAIKKKKAMERQTERELNHRSDGKGCLMDKKQPSLKSVKVSEIRAEAEELGTVSIKTNCTDLNARQVYGIYRRWQAIERFFKTRGDTLSLEAFYMRNHYTEEAWLFIHYLSSYIEANVVEEISSIGESMNISYEDLIQTLAKIQAGKIGGNWVVPPVKKSVQRLCRKLQFDPGNLSVLKILGG